MATDMQNAMTTIRIVNDAPGLWSVEAPDGASLGTYASEGEAVARAWDLIRGRPGAEILFQTTTESIRLEVTSVTSKPVVPTRGALEDAEEQALYREAERRMPSFDQLRELMNRLPKSTIDYSQEDDGLPC